MNRHSDMRNMERFSYPEDRQEVQFLPNPSLNSNQRLLTPSVTSSVYENDPRLMDENSTHHYEDPARLAQQMLTHQGPRKKANNLYEPTTIPLKEVKKRVRNLSRSSDDSATGYMYHGREPVCHRIILYTVLLLSLTASVLVVLMILGIVGPACHCSKQQIVKTKAGSSQTSHSFSAEPFEQKLSSLQENLTRLESLLREKQPNQDVQVKVVNGTVSLMAIQHMIDAKLNVTSSKRQITDELLRTELQHINHTLTSKFRSVSKIEGLAGAPGVNGSRGEQGNPGLRGLQGIQGSPGWNGSRGPPGPENFGVCTYHKLKAKSHPQSDATVAEVNQIEPPDFIIIGPSCSTIGAKEYNLKVNVRSFGKPNFVCTCKGVSVLFPPEADPDTSDKDKKVICYLHYWLCPKKT